MKKMCTFANTRRAISVSFDLPGANALVAQENLQSCNKLATFLYPVYIDQKDKPLDGQKSQVVGKVISRPPLVSVHYANLISAGGSPLLGYLSGLEWSPVLDMGMYTSDNQLYPKVVSLSFTLNVLHQATKGWDEDNDWISSPLIG